MSLLTATTRLIHPASDVNKTQITESRQPQFQLAFSDGNANRTPVTAAGQPPSWFIIKPKYGETWIFCFLTFGRRHLNCEFVLPV
jgi:hypothetical protein